MSKIRTTSTGQKSFVCPGCGHYHSLPIRIAGKPIAHPLWEYNGNPDRPTFQPSILSWHEPWDEEKQTTKKEVCHSFVTDGMIRFLPDSTHALAGKTVPLEDV